MSMKLPNGAILSLASTFGTAAAVTAITAASPAVATAGSGHGITAGDVAVLACGWDALNGQVIKASAADSTTVTLQGVDTTDATRFPAGGGVGTLTEITGWAPIPTVIDFATNGGDQQYVDVQPLASDVIQQLPTVRTALSLSLRVADEPGAAWYVAMRKASDTRAVTPIRLALRDGSVIYYNGYISMAPSPQVSVNNVMTIQVNIAILPAGVSRF